MKPVGFEGEAASARRLPQRPRVAEQEAIVIPSKLGYTQPGNG